MKNTVHLTIKIISFIAVILFLFTQCNNYENKKSNINKTKEIKRIKEKKKVQKSTKKIIKLNNNNVVKELTKYGNKNKETLILLKTPKGNMKIKLYKNTPLHRANIIRLIKNDFYKGTVFYRVIKGFMIQGGDSEGWERQNIKSAMGTYTLPAEFRKNNIHKKGAVAMAREYKNNPKKRSVSFEFFIVQGTKYTEPELRGAELEYKLKINAKHKKIYKTQGGCPHLDGQHTVFGQVIEGLNVIDKIANTKIDEGNWPINDITIDFEILK